MKGSRIHYGWVIFAAAFVTLVGAAGFRSAAGVLVDPLRDEFGWSRSTVGAAVSINVILFGLMGPFAAALQLRFGLRRVTMAALVAIGLGGLATTQMSSPIHLFIVWGVVVGAGSGCMATVFASTVASRWFVAHRGLVTGALTAASASGQLVFLPVLTNLAEDHGWRTVGTTIGLCAIAVVPIVFLFLRDSPADVGLHPVGASEDHEPPHPLTNPIRSAFGALNDARHDYIFWLLWGSFLVCGLSTNGLIGTHFLSAAHDYHFAAATAAGYLALIGGFDVLGTIASGTLTDRFDPARLLAAYYGFRGVSLLFLDPALTNGGLGLVGFMVFYGLDWVATVPPTVALCIRRFGADRGPLVYGWVFAGHQIGAAIAAWGAGALRDATGSYAIAFYVAGAACLLAAFGASQMTQRKVTLSAIAATTPRPR